MRRQWRARREAIRLGKLPRKTKPPRCTSAEFFFSCCDSAAALPALANYNERRGAASNGAGTTIKHLRRTTSSAAGSSLGTTIKYLRRTTSGAGGNGRSTTIKYLRGAAVIGLGTTINCLQRTTRKRPGHHGQVSACGA